MHDIAYEGGQTGASTSDRLCPVLAALTGSFDKVSAVIKVCRKMTVLTATTWQCREYHTGLHAVRETDNFGHAA